MERKEEWINSTMSGLDGLQQLELSSDLKKTILTSAASAHVRVYYIKPAVKWSIAASLALLIGLNIISLLQLNKYSAAGHNDSNPIYKEYFSYLNEF